jgi:hypothetical protein
MDNLRWGLAQSPPLWRVPNKAPSLPSLSQINVSLLILSLSEPVPPVICWARAPRGVAATRQGIVLTDLESLLDCQ